ncbi:hypothetical protein [Burkholderia territorii]|nr:hypothetical protein [Burkholderia territorii]MBM2772576.1 hypothetical protein [Burkholderia territorii]
MARVGFTVYRDRFNRQLHQDAQFDERALAKRLAETSNGRYTQAQIQDQMRIMGASIGLHHESGAPATLVGQVPTDSGAQWIGAKPTANGITVLTQKTAQSDPQIQACILDNYNKVMPDDVPSMVTYDVPSSNVWGFNVSGPFTKFDQSDLNYLRDTTAGLASMVSTNAGRFSAATGAAAEIPSPYAPGFASATLAGTVLGFGASVVEQIVRPNPVGFSVDSTVDLLLYRVAEKFPLWGPMINEIGNGIKDSNWINEMKDQGKSRK